MLDSIDVQHAIYLQVQHTSMKHEQLAQQLEEELGKRDRRLEKFLLKPNDEGLEQLQVNEVDENLSLEEYNIIEGGR